MQQLVNVKGHYPHGYPIGTGVASGPSYNVSELEQATDKPNLTVFKTAIEDARGAGISADYFSRCANARDWWYARWPMQTADGRKWGDPAFGVQAWPWPGACDTRVRTVERVIGEHRTLMTFALRNMKWQAKSTRPSNTIRESQQATTLLNWMLFSHMQAELHRELRLAVSWRNGYGSSILDVDWKQTRRLDYIDVSVPGLQEFVNEPSVASFLQGSMGNIPIGENLNITDLQEMIMDPAYADDLAQLLRSVSHEFLSLSEARRKLDDLRQLRTVEIPIPYVYESRPRITALRPFVDCFFPPMAGDLQIASFYDRIEFVSETTLRDRIETAGYNKRFVDEAVDRRGPTAGTDWSQITNFERAGLTNVSPSMEADIELHHFYSLVQDRGVPVRFCTVFHMDIDIAAKHVPAGYDHGEATVHPMRFEIEDRPILSSRGIAEIAYTWEVELKKQYDMQADRVDLTLRPPLMTTYDQVQKMKENVQPGVIFPMNRFDTYEWMKMPPVDQVSILIIQEVEKRVKDHFAIFGNEVDPDLKKLRREEMVDDLVIELKPVNQQIMKLLKQLMPDAQVAAVVGPLARPFHVNRQDIQDEFDLTGSVDLRDIDNDWLKEKLQYMVQVASLDTTGTLDRNRLVRIGAEAISSDIADELVKDQSVATQAEIQDEQRAIDLIIGSGQDQPLPMGANYQLRLQTLQAKQQSIMTNPATMKIIQGNPEIIKVLLNRAQFFQRQIQQQQNAQIGRMQVSQTFTKNAPTPDASPMGVPAPY